MESILLTIHPQDPIWMIIALFCGLFASVLRQPPLVGFLAAGFLLNTFGVGVSEFLRITADLGITLLLFTLGLKLKLKSLFNRQVLGVATSHLVITTCGLTGLVLCLSWGLNIVGVIDFKTALLVGFALSFSSTVFAVKILDEMGASGTHHGKLSIAILIIQDIAAVAFVAASAGKWPSPWALCLLVIIPLRKLFHMILDRTGHGELLILFGISLAIGGADLFELFDMKGDLGALVIGMLFASHPKSNELAKGLLGFKNLFLVGFFLTVGMSAPPSWNELGIALCILAFLPFKVALYFTLFAKSGLRSRTSWQSSLNLANFSEFGLIVGSIAVSKNWLPPSWLAVFAILLALSFIISAPLATMGDEVYSRWTWLLKRFDNNLSLAKKEALLKQKDIIIIGMGRVGTSIFDKLSEEIPGKVVGVDTDESKVKEYMNSGRSMLLGDGTNPDLWVRSADLLTNAKWVILTLPSQQAMYSAAQRLKELQFAGKIAAATRYTDEEEPLREHGVEFTFNIHAEAGRGFATDFLEQSKYKVKRV